MPVACLWDASVNIFVILFLLGMALGLPMRVQAVSAASPTLADYRAVYERELAGIFTNNAPVHSADDAYLRSLDTLQTNYRRDGDFDGVTAVTTERKRFEATKMAPNQSPTNLLPAIEKAQTNYRSALAQVETSRTDQLDKLATSYLKALKGLIKALLAQDKMTEAEAVNAEMKRVKAERKIADEPTTTTGVVESQPKPDLRPPPLAPVNGLIAWYPLQGDAKDASGNGLDGVLTKNVLPATDRFGTPNAALRFTGNNSYVRIADFVHNHKEFAACVWVKPSRSSPLAQVQDIISKHSNTVDMELLVRRELDGKYGIGWNIGGVFIEFDSTNVGIVEPTYTSWDFLVLQYTGSSIQFYVNGKLVRERNVSGTIVINQQDLTFGGYGANPNVESFIGLMDDVRFYNRALSPTEITQLYSLRK